MTLQLNSALVTEIGKACLYPTYMVKIEGVPYWFGDGSLGFSAPLVYGGGKTYGAQPSGVDAGTTYHYGDSVADTSVSVRRLKRPTGFEAEASPEQGDASWGGAQCGIQDCPELRDMIAGYAPLKGKQIEIYMGAANIPANTWAIVYTGLIHRTAQWDDYLGLTIDCVDVTRLTKPDVFELSQTELTAPIDASVSTSFPVISTAAFASASGATPAPAQYLIQIDKEVCLYTATGATTFGSGSGGSITRGYLGSTAAAHSAGTKVTELLVLRGHPMDIARWVMLSTGTGTNTGGGTNYDILPARHGLAMPWKFIDIASSKSTSFASAKAALGGVVFEFQIGEKENGRDFLSHEINKTCNLLPIVYGDGREGVAVFQPPEADAGLFEFNADVIIDGSAHPTNNEERIYNECRWQYDWDPIERKFRALKIYTDPISPTKYGRVYPMPFEAKGLRSLLSGETIAISHSQRFLTRFSEPPIEIEAEGSWATLGVEVGDLVTFSSRRCKDPKTGEPGMGPVTVQVTGKAMDFDRGVMRFRFQYAFANFKYGRIPPYGTPNYSSASAAQRAAYVFAADPLLPDGSQPYRMG